MTRESRAERRWEAEATIARVTRWAIERSDIRVLLIVGSYARASATASSDIDLVVLTTARDRYLEHVDWAVEIGGALVRTRQWGAIAERRVRLRSGLELDFGFGHESWAAGPPLDPGTRQVLDGGFRVLLDRDDAMSTVAEHLRLPPNALP